MLTIRRGDTCVVNISLNRKLDNTSDTPEKMYLSIGLPSNPIIIKEITGDTATLEHKDTIKLLPGEYVMEVRVFTDDRTYVETPIYNRLKILDSINVDLVDTPIDDGFGGKV